MRANILVPAVVRLLVFTILGVLAAAVLVWTFDHDATVTPVTTPTVTNS